jgi:hypothetical protein
MDTAERRVARTCRVQVIAGAPVEAVWRVIADPTRTQIDPLQSDRICAPRLMIAEDAIAVHIGGYRVSRDSRAVTVCNQVPVPE